MAIASTITTIETVPASRNTAYFWQGTIERKRTAGEVFRRIGATGSEVNLMGSVAPISNPSFSELFTTHSDLITARLFYEALKLKYVTIALNTGESFTPVLVHDVAIREKRGRIKYNGTVYSYKLDISLQVEVQ